LSLFVFFGENSPFLKKLKEFTNFCAFIGSTTADALFSADMCSLTVPLPFTLKSILMQKKNYENSNIPPCKKYNLQKNPLKETKILQDIITL